jgi:hypothetical protein
MKEPNGKTDEEFANKGLYKQYWTKDPDWNYTSKNESTFKSLVGKSINRNTISIKSEFNYTPFVNEL